MSIWIKKEINHSYQGNIARNVPYSSLEANEQFQKALSSEIKSIDVDSRHDDPVRDTISYRSKDIKIQQDMNRAEVDFNQIKELANSSYDEVARVVIIIFLSDVDTC